MPRSRSRSRSPKRERRRSRSRSRDRERDKDRKRRRSRSRDKGRRRSRDRERRHDRDDSRRHERHRSDRDRERGSSRDHRRSTKQDSSSEDELIFQAVEKNVTEEDIQSMPEDEQELMRVMGFSGFDTTKDKQVVGNEHYAANICKKRRYRQYMNRKGGFNRPLDFIA